MEISFLDRCRARDIIHKLRNQVSLKDVASMLGIRKAYVTYTEHMTRRLNYTLTTKGNTVYYEHNYLTPKAVIKMILAWGKDA